MLKFNNYGQGIVSNDSTWPGCNITWAQYTPQTRVVQWRAVLDYRRRPCPCKRSHFDPHSRCTNWCKQTIPSTNPSNTVCTVFFTGVVSRPSSLQLTMTGSWVSGLYSGVFILTRCIGEEECVLIPNETQSYSVSPPFDIAIRLNSLFNTFLNSTFAGAGAATPFIEGKKRVRLVTLKKMFKLLGVDSWVPDLEVALQGGTNVRELITLITSNHATFVRQTNATFHQTSSCFHQTNTSSDRNSSHLHLPSLRKTPLFRNHLNNLALLTFFGYTPELSPMTLGTPVEHCELGLGSIVELLSGPPHVNGSCDDVGSFVTPGYFSSAKVLFASGAVATFTHAQLNATTSPARFVSMAFPSHPDTEQHFLGTIFRSIFRLFSDFELAAVSSEKGNPHASPVSFFQNTCEPTRETIARALQHEVDVKVALACQNLVKFPGMSALLHSDASNIPGFGLRLYSLATTPIPLKSLFR